MTFTGDVRPFETAKLRLLNGAHSSLAYIGLGRGLETVAEAMADRELAAFAERLMREDIAPSVSAPAGLDLQACISDILARFANPAIRHLLSQIAWDGSQKLPYRLLDTVRAALAAGRPVARLALPIAAWLRFLAAAAREGRPITDPLSGPLLQRAEDWRAVLAMREVFGELGADPASSARWRPASQDWRRDVSTLPASTERGGPVGVRPGRVPWTRRARVPAHGAWSVLPHCLRSVRSVARRRWPPFHRKGAGPR